MQDFNFAQILTKLAQISPQKIARGCGCIHSSYGTEKYSMMKRNKLGIRI